MEVAEFVGVSVDGDDAEPVPEGVPLQVLLGQVLEISVISSRRGRGGADLLEKGISVITEALVLAISTLTLLAASWPVFPLILMCSFRKVS